MKRIKLVDAAQRLGITALTLKAALQQGLLPIGIAVKNDCTYSYYIWEDLLEKFEKGETVWLGNISLDERLQTGFVTFREEKESEKNKTNRMVSRQA